MNLTNEHITLIERFVQEQCSRREEQLVQREMALDENFAKAVAQYRKLHAGLKELRIKEIEQELLALGNKEEDVGIADPKLVAELELIERYYHRKLTATELKVFEKRLKTDPEFARKVKEYEAIFGGLREKRVKKIESEVKEAVATNQGAKVVNLQEKAKKSIIRRLMPILAAAAVLLGAVAILPLLLVSGDDFQSALVKKYGESPSSSTMMSGATAISPVEKAMGLLNEKKYKEAELLLQNLNSDSSKLYLADAQFAQKEYPAALQNYQAAQNSSNSDLSNRADWFVVQCLLRIKPLDEKSLQESLSSITKKTGIHNYRNSARALQMELGNGFAKWRLKWGSIF